MRRDGVLEAESARHFLMARADAANLAAGLRLSRAHGEIHRLRQIELAIAIAIGTGKTEVRRRRWMKDRHLGRWKKFPVVAEIEIDLQRIEAGITRAHCRRCGTSATLAFTHRLPSNCWRRACGPHDITWLAMSTGSMVADSHLERFLVVGQGLSPGEMGDRQEDAWPAREDSEVTVAGRKVARTAWLREGQVEDSQPGLQCSGEAATR